jgi:deoxyribodipyrimidine photo-lyase
MGLSERVTALSEGEENPRARYVLYWMQMFKRVRDNDSLNFAINAANDRNLPLVVYEGLKYYYPWANDRIHTFILEGVSENRKSFERLDIRYVFYLQRNRSDPEDIVAKLARDAALLVTDDYPCFIIPEHNRRIAERLKIPVYAVDSNGMIPLGCYDREEYAAFTIRPRIHKLLPKHLARNPIPRLKRKATQLELDCPETDVNSENIARLVAECDIDHSVTPSHQYKGGTAAARKRLQHFVSAILPRYDELRNEPSVDGTSRLSPYLHFGFISIKEIAAAVNKANARKEAKTAFLEEAIVRRELSFNFTKFNASYDSLKSVPSWAQQTMREHSEDPRPDLLAAEKIESAETPDELWNAAQRELLVTGEMHNYVRMLWGKRVIEWQPSYETAFALLEHLNNKYALDGRDPNSYAGILWCFGKHDRAWGPERPIFGKLRYMTSRSMAKKFDAKKYVDWTLELQRNLAVGGQQSKVLKRKVTKAGSE